MVIFPLLSPIPQHVDDPGKMLMTRDHDAAFSVRSQILSRIETEAGQIPETTHPLSEMLRAVGLTRILNDGHAMSPGNLGDGSHIGGLAVQMNGNERLCAMAARSLPLIRVLRI